MTDYNAGRLDVDAAAMLQVLASARAQVSGRGVDYVTARGSEYEQRGEFAVSADQVYLEPGWDGASWLVELLTQIEHAVTRVLGAPVGHSDLELSAEAFLNLADGEREHVHRLLYAWVQDHTRDLWDVAVNVAALVDSAELIRDYRHEIQAGAYDGYARSDEDWGD